MASDEAPFREWNNDEYANLLSFYTRIPRDIIFVPPRVMTWLRDETTDLKPMPLRDNPVTMEDHLGIYRPS